MFDYHRAWTRTRIWRRGAFGTLLLCQFLAPAFAQPLIQDGLSVYYDFDSFTDRVADRSGNSLNALVELSLNGVGHDASLDRLPDVRRSFDSVRGVGAALFDTNSDFPEDHIQICQSNDSTAINFCGHIEPTLVPSFSLTVSAWVKLQQVSQDQSLLVFRGTGSTTSQLGVDATGQLAVTLTGQTADDILVSQHVYLDGSTDNTAKAVPYDEWFHWAVTYDAIVSHYAIYFNGRVVTEGTPLQTGAAGQLGDWSQDVLLGLTADGQQQWVGSMDEFYMFRRALSPAEIAQLAELIGDPAPGDFDDNSELDGIDIEVLSAAIRVGVSDEVFDLNQDGVVDDADRITWVHDLKRTYFGDSNTDGSFDTGDLVDVFIAGEYEDSIPGNSAWWEGDWTGDGEFDTSDIVLAFADGGYELGPRAAVYTVPEPGIWPWGLMAIAMVVYGRRSSESAAGSIG